MAQHSIIENIHRNTEDWFAVKEAVRGKGVDCPDDTPTADVAGKIEDIETNEHYVNELVECIERTYVTIDFPPTVTKIGEKAFMDSEALTNVILNSNCKTIGNSAFSGCTRLQSINLDNVEVIDRNAFGQCDNLTSIGSTANIVEFTMECFSGCERLQAEIDFSNCRFIRDDAFDGCSNISLSNLNKVEIIGDRSFYRCFMEGNLILPNTLTGIGSKAFQDNYFNSITLPNSIIAISGEAFKGSYELTTLYILFTAIPPDGWLGNNIFAGSSQLTDVYFAGDETQWNLISANFNFGSLPTIHYNYTPA